MSERISDERLNQIIGSECGGLLPRLEQVSIALELKEARSTIRLLTAALERRVNWASGSSRIAATALLERSVERTQPWKPGGNGSNPRRLRPLDWFVIAVGAAGVALAIWLQTMRHP